MAIIRKHEFVRRVKLEQKGKAKGKTVKSGPPTNVPLWSTGRSGASVAANNSRDSLGMKTPQVMEPVGRVEVDGVLSGMF